MQPTATKTNSINSITAAGLSVSVRRHINWNNQRPDLKEDLAHLV